MRYSVLTPSERGFDSTVAPATEAEKALFRSHIKDYLIRTKTNNLRQYPGIENTGDEDFPVSKVQLNDTDGTVHWYLTCKPSYVPYNTAPCGRFTRGFIAVRVLPDQRSGRPSRRTSTSNDRKGKLDLLRDCWRPANNDSELTMYDYLREKNVPNLPEVICGGDVLEDEKAQEMENDLLLTDPSVVWRRPTTDVQHRIHYRIIQGLLIPLWHAESARELLRAGRDVLESER